MYISNRNVYESVPDKQKKYANSMVSGKSGPETEKFDYFFTIFLLFPLYNNT